MTTNTRIDKLLLTDFRLFDSLECDLHPELNVIVAPNGGGKTALLDAVAIVLERFLKGMGEKAGLRATSTDLRRIRTREGTMQAVLAAELVANLTILGDSTTERVGIGDLAEVSAPAPTDHALLKIGKQLARRVVEYADNKRDSAPTLPILAYYRTGRLWNYRPAKPLPTNADPTPNARSRGYALAFSPTSKFSAFLDWFRDYSAEARQEDATGIPSPHRPRVALAAVQLAVTQVLGGSTGWSNLEWDFPEKTIRIHHRDHGYLPVYTLSDGLRTMIGLVADLARRAQLLNPQLATEALWAPGIVIIDEIDMHLHPEWQQAVLTSLRETFPNIQFIVTTHSPQVLSTVPRECIRILEHTPEDGWHARIPEEQTEGVTSALVMAAVMGVDGTPDNEHVRRLRKYGSLIAAGQADSENARRLRASLDKHFGPQSAVMLECDRVIRLEDMKRRMLKREGA